MVDDDEENKKSHTPSIAFQHPSSLSFVGAAMSIVFVAMKVLLQ